MQILFDGLYANNLQIISAKPVQSVFLWRRLSKTLKNYQNLTTESGSKLRFSLLKEKVVIQVVRVPGGTIVLSQERKERSRTIPSFRKNERLERVLKNIGTISKRTERNTTGIDWTERLKSLTRSYYQELVLSWERILNQECVLNPLEIVKDVFI